MNFLKKIFTLLNKITEKKEENFLKTNRQQVEEPIVKNEKEYILILKEKNVKGSKNENVKADKDPELYFYEKQIGINHKKYYQSHIRLERDGKLISTKNYQEGDIIYLLRHNVKRNYMNVIIYEIIIEDNEYGAEKIKQIKITCINDIFRSKLPEPIEDVIWKKFRELVRY